jgi:hypothetical protein
MFETMRMLGAERERELLHEAERLHRGAIARGGGDRHRSVLSRIDVRRALAGVPLPRWLRRLRTLSLH